jgi:hypothetical protein
MRSGSDLLNDDPDILYPRNSMIMNRFINERFLSILLCVVSGSTNFKLKKIPLETSPLLSGKDLPIAHFKAKNCRHLCE